MGILSKLFPKTPNSTKVVREKYASYMRGGMGWFFLIIAEDGAYVEGGNPEWFTAAVVGQPFTTEWEKE